MLKRFGSAALGALLLIATPVGAQTLAAEAPRASRYTKFTFEADDPLDLRSDGFNVHALEIFVVRGALEGPKYLRAKFDARVGQFWQQIDTEMTGMDYTDQEGVARVHAALADQARQFADALGAEVPTLETTAFTPSAIVGVTWFNNFGASARGLAAGRPIPWVATEVAVGTLRHVFKNAVDLLPVHLRLRHLTWMPTSGPEIAFREFRVEGRMNETAMTREEALELELRLAPCDGVLAN